MKWLVALLLISLGDTPQFWHNVEDEVQVRYFHGINNSCVGEHRLWYSVLSEVSFKCVETGKSAIGNFEEHVKRGCDALMAEIDLLKNGFTIFGNSQGGLIARHILINCPAGKYVRRLITYASPHNGVVAIPKMDPQGFLSRTLVRLCELGWARKWIVPCAYVWGPKEESGWMEGNQFLKDLSGTDDLENEARKRFLNLDAFVAIWHHEDTMVRPPNSGAFGFYRPGSYSELAPLEATPLWTKDTLGLRRLHESGRLFRCRLPEGHDRITRGDFRILVVDFLDHRDRKYEQNLGELKKMCRFVHRPKG